MSTDAKRAANAAYQRRQDALTIRPPRAEGSAIRSAAAAAGMSAQAWIRAACAEKMRRDGFTPPDDADQTDT